MSKWYLIDPKACKYLFIVMERSKRPLRITAMKLSALSLTAFAAVSISSCNVLLLTLRFVCVVDTSMVLLVPYTALEGLQQTIFTACKMNYSVILS